MSLMTPACMLMLEFTPTSRFTSKFSLAHVTCGMQLPVIASECMCVQRQVNDAMLLYITHAKMLE